MLVGVQLTWLTWIDAPGKLAGFLIRIGMILFGAITIYLSQGNWREESDQEHDFLVRDYSED